ncbi:COG4315 family predicted lipoprotein [Dactylosporangium sp. CA-139114]|uniref:COG4315 family predicted lipoprotein n=1 Tax=Dactylosporangium sp. CA-139114 TaxID=3239931 RepID=UPI003D9813F6
MAATRLTATVAGCAAAAAALAALTACAPPGANVDNTVDAAQAQAQVPALNDVAGESAVPVVAPVGSQTTALKAASIPKMGKVVTDQDGFVLYRFDKDTAKPPKSNCVDKCAQVWPPAITDGNPDLSGVDPSVVGTVTRADGARQITLAGWPVYRYIGDPKPGAWKGQNVGGVWFVVAPDGKKNLTCLPTPAPTAVEPPAASAAPTGDGGTGGY